jgi:hypothetical protein
MAASLAFRLAAKANSDMAKTPLMIVKKAINKKSIDALCQGLSQSQIVLVNSRKNERNCNDNVIFKEIGIKAWQFIGLVTYRAVTPRWASSWNRLVFQPAEIAFMF